MSLFPLKVGAIRSEWDSKYYGVLKRFRRRVWMRVFELIFCVCVLRCATKILVLVFIYLFAYMLRLKRCQKTKIRGKIPNFFEYAKIWSHTFWHSQLADYLPLKSEGIPIRLARIIWIFWSFQRSWGPFLTPRE